MTHGISIQKYLNENIIPLTPSPKKFTLNPKPNYTPFLKITTTAISFT
jgi:hypothetical protein